MAPTSGHSSNHSTSSNGSKQAAVAARHERTPGTPKKESSSGRERALQDPGLKDYVCVLISPRAHQDEGTRRIAFLIIALQDHLANV